jgi:hypothetical protein
VADESLAGCAAARAEHDLGWAITMIGRAFQQWAGASVANLPAGRVAAATKAETTDSPL